METFLNVSMDNGAKLGMHQYLIRQPAILIELHGKGYINVLVHGRCVS